MIFIFLYAWNFFWLEQEVICHHFENSAGEGKNICVVIIFVSEDDLGGTVLSGLNVICEMFISETCVAHVDYFEEKFVVEFYFDAFPF